MPIIGGRGAGVRGLGFQGAGAPAQVTGLTATNVGLGRAFNNGRIDLSWAAPATNGAPITGYRIERSTNGSTYSTLVASHGPTSYSDTGLTSAQQYWYRVAAINAVGTGLNSSAANATATTVPQAPTIGTPQSGDESAQVFFTAGANGGSAITSFAAQSSPGGNNGSGSSSPITVTQLTNGTAYTFTVVAINGNGTSAASSASPSVTPQSPTIFIAVGESGVAVRRTGGFQTGTWTTVSIPGTVSKTAIAYGNGVWMAGDVNGVLYRSTDQGISWTSVISFGSIRPVNQIAYANGVWLGAVGISDPGSSQIRRSTDNGLTWATVSVIGFTGYRINDVAYGNGLWVVVANGGKIATSSDGLTWTSRTSGVTSDLGAVAYGLNYGSGTWVATGVGGPNQGPRVLRSSDAITWTLNQLNGNTFGFGSTTQKDFNGGTQSVSFGRSVYGSDRWYMSFPELYGAFAESQGFYSTTGADVSQTPMAGEGDFFSDIAYGSNMWIAVGTSQQGTTYAYRTEGSWVYRDSLGPLIGFKQLFAVASNKS